MEQTMMEMDVLLFEGEETFEFLGPRGESGSFFAIAGRRGRGIRDGEVGDGGHGEGAEVETGGGVGGGGWGGVWIIRVGGSGIGVAGSCWIGFVLGGGWRGRRSCGTRGWTEWWFDWLGRRRGFFDRCVGGS